MTLLHKSQVHCSGVMQWWDCSSLVSAALLAEQGCGAGTQISVSGSSFERLNFLAPSPPPVPTSKSFWLRLQNNLVQKIIKKHCIICISRLPHKPSPWTGTQISCFGSTIQNCSGSTSTALLQRKVAKLAKGLFWCLSLLRSNNIATNLQTRFSFYLSKIILSFLSTFCVFVVRICFFSLCHQGLFEITEWGPINRGAVWFNSFKSLKNDKCQSCQFP